MKALEDLISSLSYLPGVGSRGARRIAYFILNSDDHYLNRLTENIKSIKTAIRACPVCGYYSEGEQCTICSDHQRSRRIICVVETAQDAANIELTGEYRGLYHVLGGVIAPLDGVGPEDLAIESLLQRSTDIDEVVLATNLTIEGDVTALYIQQMLKEYSLVVSRIAGGLPVGGGLQYADKQTLGRSIKGRGSL